MGEGISKHLGGIIGCKDKNLSMAFNCSGVLQNYVLICLFNEKSERT